MNTRFYNEKIMYILNSYFTRTNTFAPSLEKWFTGLFCKAQCKWREAWIGSACNPLHKVFIKIIGIFFINGISLDYQQLDYPWPVGSN